MEKNLKDTLSELREKWRNMAISNYRQELNLTTDKILNEIIVDLDNIKMVCENRKRF